MKYRKTVYEYGCVLCMGDQDLSNGARYGRLFYITSTATIRQLLEVLLRI
jgi:hypothetical protein